MPRPRPALGIPDAAISADRRHVERFRDLLAKVNQQRAADGVPLLENGHLLSLLMDAYERQAAG
jgi:hypothetical protein